MSMLQMHEMDMSPGGSVEIYIRYMHYWHTYTYGIHELYMGTDWVTELVSEVCSGSLGNYILVGTVSVWRSEAPVV